MIRKMLWKAAAGTVAAMTLCLLLAAVLPAAASRNTGTDRPTGAGTVQAYEAPVAASSALASWRVPTAPRTASAVPAFDPGAVTLSLTRVTSGLTAPVLVTNAHDGSRRLFVLEQAGR